MKKLFLSILAVAALASCSKTESAYVDQDQEIKLAPVASMVTKANVTAAIDGTTYPTREDFGVVAYWKNVPAGEKFNDKKNITTYLGNENNGAVKFINKGSFWGGNTTYYWPKNGSLRFAAYSPFELNQDAKVYHNIETDVYTIKDYVQPTNTKDTWDLMIAPTSESYTAQTSANNVSVVFEHALSWITLKVKATETAKEAFTLKELTIKNVCYTGNLVADMINKTKIWEEGTVKNDYTVYTGSVWVTEDAAIRENVDKGTLIIPQPTTKVYIKFDQRPLDGTPALTDQELTIPLTLNSNMDEWEAGKHYVYTIIFDLDEILINPSVEDWEDVNVNDVPTTEVKVATTE